MEQFIQCTQSVCLCVNVITECLDGFLWHLRWFLIGQEDNSVILLVSSLCLHVSVCLCVHCFLLYTCTHRVLFYNLLSPPRRLYFHLFLFACVSIVFSYIHVRTVYCFTTYYLRQGDYIFTSFCLPLCLLTILLENYWPNPYEILWNDWTLSRDQRIRFWVEVTGGEKVIFANKSFKIVSDICENNVPYSAPWGSGLDPLSG